MSSTCFLSPTKAGQGASESLKPSTLPDQSARLDPKGVIKVWDRAKTPGSNRMKGPLAVPSVGS